MKLHKSFSCIDNMRLQKQSWGAA